MLLDSGATQRAVLTGRRYVATRASFEVFRTRLQEIPSKKLITDSALEELWCALLRQERPAHAPCVQLRHVSVVHMDTHMYMHCTCMFMNVCIRTVSS